MLNTDSRPAIKESVVESDDSAIESADSIANSKADPSESARGYEP